MAGASCDILEQQPEIWRDNKMNGWRRQCLPDAVLKDYLTRVPF